MATIGEIDQKETCVIEWHIKKFSSFLSVVDVSYCSPWFNFAKLNWHIEMRTNRQETETSQKFISLFLQRISYGPPVQIEYTLGAKTIHEKLDPKRKMTYIFRVRGGYGIYNFLNYSEVFDMKYCIASPDTHVFVCNLKHSISPEDESKDFSTFRAYKVLQDYKELFHKQNDCDVIIRVKEQEFPAHRIILSARSSVFKSTLVKIKRRGRVGGIIDIEDSDPSTFSDFLCFLYCGDADIITGENVFSLFTAADKYDVKDLTDRCLEFLKENVSVDTFCDTLTLALQHSQTELIALTSDFFNNNAHKIVKTVKWESYLALNPTASNELLIKAFGSFQDKKK